MTTTGFFTDSTLCIGCKACEVACKEWNDVPSDGYALSGNSYDNTGGLGHSTWRHVKFVEGETSIGAGGNAPEPDVVGVLVGRLQALRERRLSRVVSDRLDHPHRVRRRLHPARHLQRLRLLRGDLPVRRRSTAVPPTAARSSARSATTARRRVRRRPARRRVRRSRSSSAISKSWSAWPTSASPSCMPPA